MSTLKEKSFNALVWDLGGRLIMQIVGLGISIFLARLLPPEDFGLMAMVLVIIAISNIFVTSGLDLALIQRKEVDEYHYGAVLCVNVSIGLFLTIVSFLLSGIIANFYENQDVKPIMQVASLSFIIYSFGRVKTAYLTRNLRMNIISKANIISIIFGGGTAIVLAHMGFGVWALVIQNLVAGIIYNIFLYFAVRWNPKFRFKMESLKQLWSFGFRLFISKFINTFSARLDNMIIGKLFNATTLGFYFRAKNTNEYVINFSSSSLASVFLPVLSKVQNDEERFIRIFKKTFHLVCFLSVLISAYLNLIGEELIVLLFSEKWIASAKYFEIIVIGSLCYPTSTLLLMILTSRGNAKSVLKLELIKQILVISTLSVGFLISIEFYLYAFVSILFLSVYLNIYYASKELNIKNWFFLEIILQYIALGLVVSSACYLLEYFFLEDMPYIAKISLNTISLFGSYFFISYLAKMEGCLSFLNELKSVYAKLTPKKGA